jgi:hypothetical protein
MSKKDENLFSGLQIMSPEETMGMSTSEEENTSIETSVEEEVENSETITSDTGLTITTPVPGTSSNEDNNEDEDSVSSTGSNVHAAFIKEMVGAGIISGPGEEAELEELLKDASVDTIKELMEKTVDGRVESKQEDWKKGLSSTKKRFLDIEDSFSETDTAIQMAQRLEYLDSITSSQLNEDVGVQQNLYYEDLKLKGFSHEDALEAVGEAKSLNKLSEKASRALTSIKKHDNGVVDANKVKLEEQKQELQKNNQEAYESLMSNIDKKDAFIEGLNLNKTIRDKIKNNIINPVHEDENGNRLTSLMYKQQKNPSEFDMLINYYDTLGLFNLDNDGSFKPDISKIKNAVKTKVSSELDSVLRSSSHGEVGQRTSVNKSSQTSNVLDFLERATGQKDRKKKR